jgi:glycosyltransferase involved in cell wall biosynthesis
MLEVDVLMPVGPGPQPWLPSAVDSILNQRDIRPHLVLSIDRHASLYLIRSDLGKSSDVDVVASASQPGVAATLNAGLHQCSTNWVARLDADDVAHPERLIHQLRASEGAILVGSRIASFSGEIPTPWLAVAHDPPVVDVAVATLLASNPIAHSSALFRRSEVCDLGGYRTNVGNLEDYDLWLRLSARGTIRRVEHPLVAYRLHEHQVTRRTRRKLAPRSRLLSSRLSAARAAGIPDWLALQTHAGYEARQVGLSIGQRVTRWKRQAMRTNSAEKQDVGME